MMEKPVTTPPQFWPFLSDGHPSDVSKLQCSRSGSLWSLQEGTSGGQLHWHQKKNTVSSTLILDQTWRAFLGLGDVLLVHCEDWTFVSTS